MSVPPDGSFPAFAEFTIGPATSGRTRWLKPGYTSPSLAPCHERQPFEQVHILLVLDQRAVQRRDEFLRIALAQRLDRDVLDHQELEPVEQLRGRRFFLHARHV